MPAPHERLRASPAFVQALTLDGRPYIAQEAEPYAQYWLAEHDRVLLSVFSRRHGATVREAIDAALRLSGKLATEAAQRRLHKAIADMLDSAVLLRAREDVSRYDADIVKAYLEHRPFPRDITAHLVKAGGIGPDTRVLDLAGGPGDLALQLAAVSNQVSLMELSKGFVQSAGKRAAAQGLKLNTLHDTCNRLIHHDETYQVITVAQALHWLDDVQVCRGVCRLLLEGGSFFVVHSAIDLPDAHPLADVLGHDSIFGRKARQSFVDEVQPLLRRLGLLFEALDAPEVQRIDPTQRQGASAAESQRIAPAGVTLFRQRMPFGVDYARGFFTPRHIESVGLKVDAFWRDLQARCDAVPAARLLGTMHWAVLHFKRGGKGLAADALVKARARPIAFP